MTKKIPMLFSAPLVRALLDGRKTQTRRVMKVQPISYVQGTPVHPEKHEKPYLDAYCGKKKTLLNPRGMSRDWCWWTTDDRCGPAIECAPCAPGDLIWVREAWARVGDNDDAIHACPNLMTHAYFKADSVQPEVLRWRPSSQMPRWASRLTLRVTDVRAQRLQDISEEDARTEGVMPNTFGRHTLWSGRENERPTLRTARSAFIEHIWDDLYREDEEKSSAANPWVWAISFDVIRKNVDEVSA